MIPKKILPVLLGAALEAYDFFLYGILAVYFSKIFFPADSEYSLFFALGLFSIAYLSNPFGAILWGHVADKHGRKKAMIGTLALMAIPAIGMAVMPGYESIGLTACILVIMLRFLQGVAFGGECPTIIISIYELAPKNKKGFYGSFYNPALLLGYLIGLILLIFLQKILGKDEFHEYGWRFMFAASFIFIFILRYVRSLLIETAPVDNKNHIPILISLKNDWRTIVKVTLYLIGCSVMFWNLLFYNYLVLDFDTLGMSGLFAQGGLIIMVIILFPLVGFLSDKVNKMKLLIATYIITMIFSVFLYKLFLTQHIASMLLGYFLFAILTAITCTTWPAVSVGQASAKCRATTIAIVCSLSMLIGSFTPLLNELIKTTTQNNLAPVALIIITAFISLLTLLTFNKKEIL